MSSQLTDGGTRCRQCTTLELMPGTGGVMPDTLDAVPRAGAWWLVAPALEVGRRPPRLELQPAEPRSVIAIVMARRRRSGSAPCGSRCADERCRISLWGSSLFASRLLPRPAPARSE